MDVGVVDAGRGDVEQLLAAPGDGAGQLDDVEDLGTPKWVICIARMWAGQAAA